MRRLILSISSLMVIATCLEACVTYNPSTGTYTVDKSGSVYHPVLEEDED